MYIYIYIYYILYDEQYFAMKIKYIRIITLEIIIYPNLVAHLIKMILNLLNDMNILWSIGQINYTVKNIFLIDSKFGN